jgi:mRNA interferase MazF
MTGTTSYQAGDLVLANLMHTSGQGSQIRPALVLLDTGDADVVVARVTTQLYATPWDVFLADWQQEGLLRPSTARLHKLLTIEKTLVIRRIGLLSPRDRQQVAAVLAQMFGTW